MGSRRMLLVSAALCCAFLVATLGTTAKWLNAVRRLNDVEDELVNVKGMVEVGRKRFKSAEQVSCSLPLPMHAALWDRAPSSGPCAAGQAHLGASVTRGETPCPQEARQAKKELTQASGELDLIRGARPRLRRPRCTRWLATSSLCCRISGRSDTVC